MGAAATINVSAGQSIQAAINNAHPGDEIVVATGTYYQRIDFKGKAITVRSTAPTSPAVVAATIINGNAGGPVVSFKTSEGAGSILDGFAITNGTGFDTGYGIAGGGVFCWKTSPIVRNCLVYGNSAPLGGGLYTGNGTPLFTGNTVRNNTATFGAGIDISYSSPTITHNTIYANTAATSGGGMFEGYSSATISSNLIYLNVSNGSAGGIGLGEWPTPVAPVAISGNVIADNSCVAVGGGVAAWDVVATITNNTISGNSALHGGGIYAGQSTVTMSNNIVAFAQSGGGVYVDTGAAPAVTFCDAYSNLGGNYLQMTDPAGANGNIATDPLFANRTTRDFALKSKGGRWNGSLWVLDTVTSPCLDAGDPASPFNLEPSPNGGRINLGYDGDTAYASKTFTPLVPVVLSCLPKGTGVARSTLVRVAFNTAMNRSLTASAFKLKLGTTVVQGAVTWTTDSKTLKFKPTLLLGSGKRYVPSVEATAKSAAGVLMAARWTGKVFTTGAAAPTLVTATAVPTASGTQIAVSLTSASDVTVTVRNLAGREVAVLTPGTLEAGVHSLLWNGTSTLGTKAPAGMYLVEVTAKASDGACCSAVASLRR